MLHKDIRETIKEYRRLERESKYARHITNMSALDMQLKCLVSDMRADKITVDKMIGGNNMKEFKGNGAECMVEFIKNGKNGHIYTILGHEVVFYDKYKKRVIFSDDNQYWLCELCRYIPPEEKIIPKWEAFAAMHRDGKKIDYKLDYKHHPYCWSPVNIHDHNWNDTSYEYRIAED